MKFGAYIFPTDYSAPVDRVGQALEERGFESIFVPEHTHIPANRETPYPGGGELPKQYSHTLDPFVALGAVAGVTKQLMLGTGISLVMERDPIILAKSVASLDHISGGRVLFGVGGGWNKEEMRNHGTDPKLRWKVLRERVEAMQAIWTQEEASYHGETLHFEKIWSWPKPVQQPHPPIILGSEGGRAFDRLLNYADGWIPFARGNEKLPEQIRELNERAAQAGRKPLTVTLFNVPTDPARLAPLLEIPGVERCLFGLPPENESVILSRLDKLVGTMQQVA
jgi:probable F420-dependent oxidoreductase